jgi:hypothetical protein
MLSRKEWFMNCSRHCRRENLLAALALLSVVLLWSPTAARAQEKKDDEPLLVKIAKFVVVHNHEIQVVVSKITNGVSSVTIVKNETDTPLMLSKMDRKAFSPDHESFLIPAHSSAPCGMWLPWCDLASDYPLHHADLAIAVDGKPSRLIGSLYQAHGVIKIAPVLSFEAGSPVDGASRGGGEKTMVVCPSAGGDYSVSLVDN